jgi:ferric-dicitrate binding protein FerR (iron transport regulator)
MRSVSTFFPALFVCAAAVAQDPSTASSAMTATIVEGHATVQAAGASSEQPLAEGAALQEGDVVQTGPDGRVEISTANGNTLRLVHDARLELRQAPQQGRTFSAHLWLGSLWLRVHKLLKDESFRVETENGVAGVRGTEFMVEAGTQGGEDRVRVYEGAVEVRDRAGEWTHRVEPGSELAFRRGARPEGPRPFDPASDRAHPLIRWVRERPVRGSEVKEPPARHEGPAREKERDKGEKKEKKRRFPK